MTKKQYDKVKNGDKIKLKLLSGEVIEVGKECYKHSINGIEGFMNINIFHHFKYCDLVKENK